MIFFYFLKIIFEITASKRSKTYKNNNNLWQKKFKIFMELNLHRVRTYVLVFMLKKRF